MLLLTSRHHSSALHLRHPADALPPRVILTQKGMSGSCLTLNEQLHFA